MGGRGDRLFRYSNATKDIVRPVEYAALIIEFHSHNFIII